MNTSFSQQGSLLDSHYTYDQGPNNPPTTFIFGPLYLASDVFQLSPIEDLTLATLLLRPLRLFSDEDLSKQLMLSFENYGSAKRVYIISEKDKVARRDLQLWMIERNPPNDVVEIKGSDHMVMMSKPIELWAHLQDIAEKYSYPIF
nr:salicylic acid-binding protein 2-like [Quercus suber]